MNDRYRYVFYTSLALRYLEYADGCRRCAMHDLRRREHYLEQADRYERYASECEAKGYASTH
jgi:hypothetical protein